MKKTTRPYTIAAILGAAFFLHGCHSPAPGVSGRGAAGGAAMDAAFDLSPDGQKLVFTGAGQGGRDIFLLDLSSSAVTQVTKTDAFEQQPVFTPDGRHIVYAASPNADGPAHIYRCDLTGTGAKQITTGAGVSDAWPHVSPDGQRIAFARSDRHRRYSMGGWIWDQWDAWEIHSNGTHLRRLTHQKDPYGYLIPRFSPKGDSIIYAAQSHGATLDSYIYVISAKGGSPRRITAAGHESGPTFAPDGARIAFISDQGKPFDYDVWTMDLKTGAAHPLKVTARTRYNAYPAFTPDGRHIYFLGDPDPGADTRMCLWRVRTDGHDLTRVADPVLFEDPLTWKPSPP